MDQKKIFLVIHHHLLEMNFENFFKYISSTISFLPFIDNEKPFFLMHNKLLSQPIYRQSQAALSVATADIDNDQTDEEKIKPTEPDNQQEKKEKDYENKLFIHYNTNTTNTIWY
jgi:hypothetical protein